jgi:hypothetical protein
MLVNWTILWRFLQVKSVMTQRRCRLTLRMAIVWIMVGEMVDVIAVSYGSGSFSLVAGGCYRMKNSDDTLIPKVVIVYWNLME